MDVVAVSGASGLVGTALVAALRTDGRRVRPLVRSRSAGVPDAIAWDPGARRIEAAEMEGLSALVHLAGENIAAGRWTARRKARIRESRVDGTRLLAETLSRLERPPEVWLSASAIGFYGDRGDERLDETSSAGQGFLADTCRAWEAACEPAERSGLRVVRLRIGVVLARRGGALARMIPLFRIGLGGRLGSGRQYMSWIGLSDLVRAIRFCIAHRDVAGPVNAVAPAPVTNSEFTATLGRLLRRPTVFPAPAPAIRLVAGEMGRELLLSSARVEPRRLGQCGFEFDNATLDSALRAELGG